MITSQRLQDINTEEVVASKTPPSTSGEYFSVLYAQLLNLPQEIKDMIWSYSLTHDRPIKLEWIRYGTVCETLQLQDRLDCFSTLLALSSTCRSIRSDFVHHNGRSILYKNNFFEL